MRPKILPRRIHRPKKARRGAGPRTHIVVILLVALALTLATLALSRSSSQASQGNSQASKKKYVATKEIIFDQASGKLRKPTPQETQDLVDQVSAFTNRSIEGLTAQQSSNGATKMSLEGGFGGVVLGRANADGTIEVRCVMSMEEAAEFLGLEESSSQN